MNRPLFARFVSRSHVLLTAVIATLSASSLKADTAALTSFTLGANLLIGGSHTMGWAFSLGSAVTIKSFGMWDQGNNGLLSSYPVDLWTSSGTHLLSATVPAGTTGTLINGFRYTSTTPTVLSPGSYVITEWEPGSGDEKAISNTNIVTAPEITYSGPRCLLSSQATFPSGNDAGYSNGYFGPNFQYTLVAPEPSAGALSATAVGLLLARRRRR